MSGALDLIDRLPLGVFLFAKAEDGYRCHLANTWFEELIQVKRPMVFGAKIEDLIVTREGEPFITHFEQCLRHNRQQQFEWEMGHGPMARYFACHLIPIEDASDKSEKILGVITDRSSEKLAERQIAHNATHDNLTGLPNRLYFQDRVEQAVNLTLEDSTRHCAVILLNIDRFQLINESLGHVAGDELLISLATRLGNCVPMGDTLARLGSDEFAILMENIQDVGEANMIADRVHAALASPFGIADDDIYTTVSIGVASTHSSNKHPEDLIRDADFAMHRAKLAGRARTEVYHQAIHSHARDRFQLETDLRHAVEQESLQLYYQPVINLKDGSLAGFEALARWPHPLRGMISPGVFIPIAEETGIIMPLGRWALREACRQLAEWRAQLGEKANKLSVSINVSSIQLARDDCEAMVNHVLEQYGLEGPALRLELTESAIVENPALALKVLSKLRALDVRLALDDFGTGYSSLSYLHRLPFDELKIDRSFVNELSPENEGFTLVETIATLGRSLGMSIVAEGIETKDQLDIVRGLKCDYGQGFLFSKPVDAQKAQQLINDWPIDLDTLD